MLAVLAVTDAGVATSGAYERGSTSSTAATGRVPRSLLSATVVADDLTTADVLATAVFALGPDGIPWALACGARGVLAMDASGRLLRCGQLAFAQPASARMTALPPGRPASRLLYCACERKAARADRRRRQPARGHARHRSSGRRASTVELARDGQRALHLGLTGAFDVVVLDRGLPAVDGLDVLRRLRENGVTTPILVLSALGTAPDRVDGLNAGAEDYLAKPFDIDELVARVRALTRRAASVVPTVRFPGGRLDTGQPNSDARRRQQDGPLGTGVRTAGAAGPPARSGLLARRSSWRRSSPLRTIPGWSTRTCITCAASSAGPSSRRSAASATGWGRSHDSRRRAGAALRVPAAGRPVRPDHPGAVRRARRGRVHRGRGRADGGGPAHARRRLHGGFCARCASQPPGHRRRPAGPTRSPRTCRKGSPTRAL